MRKPTVRRRSLTRAVLQILFSSPVPNVKRLISRSQAGCRWIFEEPTRSAVLLWITILSEQYWTAYIIDPFFSQHFRLKHRESSSPKKMLPCNECDKLYNSTASLKQHVRQKHKMKDSGRVPGYFPCPNCGKIYSYIAGLWQHTKSIHGIKS